MKRYIYLFLFLQLISNSVSGQTLLYQPGKNKGNIDLNGQYKLNEDIKLEGNNNSGTRYRVQNGNNVVFYLNGKTINAIS